MTIQRRHLLRAAGIAGGAGLAGCTRGLGGRDGPLQTEAVSDGQLVLATTTSTYDTGLLGALNPAFQESFAVTVKTLSKGTGASIRTARDGDADVVLVHARGAEDRLIRDGVGVNRRDVMFNDFVVVGPPGDPAGIEGTGDPTEAFAAIATAEVTFLSRGDESGTHTKERQIWASSDRDPGGFWYRSTGKGMGETLTQASQIRAYTLTDRGTYLSMRDELDLVVLVQGPLGGGPSILKNPYGVIPVNPAVHSHVNYQAAMAYVGFLTGPRGQGIIDDYTANGRRLFAPNALATEPPFDQYVPADYCAAVEGEGDDRATSAARPPSRLAPHDGRRP